MRIWFSVVLLFAALIGRTQLVPNAGFDSGSGGTLADWRMANQSPITTAGVLSNGVRVLWAAEATGKGKHSLQFEGQGRAEGDYALVVSPFFHLLPGESYEISFAYRASGLAPENGDRSRYTALIMDLFHDGKTRFVAATRILTSTNSDGWVRLQKIFTVPDEADHQQVRLSLTNKYPNARATLRIADISIVPLPPALGCRQSLPGRRSHH